MRDDDALQTGFILRANVLLPKKISHVLQELIRCPIIVKRKE
jgi:hypothetical protein